MEICVISDNKNHDISNTTTTGRSKMSSFVVVSVDEYAILCEILSRLPVKSLMRFKCVSKTWLSMIEEDAYFIDLHCKRSRNRPVLFYVIPLRKTGLSSNPIGDPFRVCDEFFLTADFSFERRGKREAQVQSIGKTNAFSCNDIVGPVNGLVCIVNRKRSPCDVRVYNISTREVTPWIKSAVSFEEEVGKNNITYFSHASISMNFEIGFDPGTKQHKLLCICSIELYDTGVRFEIYEVLTVGDDRWRRIHGVPRGLLNFMYNSVYANGSIYFFSSFLSDGDPTFIVVFDVGTETFRTMPVPNFILDHQPLYPYYWLRRPYLLAVDCNVAILRRMSNHILKLWIYKNDDHGKGTGATNVGDAEANWTEDIITLPFSWDKNRSVSFSNIEGTNQIVMEFFVDRKRRVNSVSLYYYDLKKKTVSEVEVSGIPSSIPDVCSVKLFTAFAESLYPLQKHKRSFGSAALTEH